MKQNNNACTSFHSFLYFNGFSIVILNVEKDQKET